MNSRLRMGVVGLVVLSLFGTLLARLWYLQVLAAPTFRVAATANGVRLVYDEAPRGRILDRSGKVLVDNRVSDAITLARVEGKGYRLGDSIGKSGVEQTYGPTCGASPASPSWRSTPEAGCCAPSAASLRSRATTSSSRWTSRSSAWPRSRWPRAWTWPITPTTRTPRRTSSPPPVRSS